MRVRLESWQNAQQQATAVGETLAGHPRPYAPVPWYWTDQYDINLQMVGGSPYRADTTVVRGNPQEKSFTVIHLARGRVIAASAVNRPKDIAPLRRAIERGDTLSHELLSRSSVPIVQVLKTGTKEIDHVA
jgi:3-phenylpropionate/trans-cinnamate dioxygenase ferredoxin reductase subunit